VLLRWRPREVEQSGGAFPRLPPPPPPLPPPLPLWEAGCPAGGGMAPTDEAAGGGAVVVVGAGRWPPAAGRCPAVGAVA